jgi:hypothetical protein
LAGKTLAGLLERLPPQIVFQGHRLQPQRLAAIQQVGDFGILLAQREPPVAYVAGQQHDAAGGLPPGGPGRQSPQQLDHARAVLGIIHDDQRRPVARHQRVQILGGHPLRQEAGVPGRLRGAQLARPVDHQPRLARTARPDEQPHADRVVLAAPGVQDLQLALPQGREKRHDLVAGVQQRRGTGRLGTLCRVGLQDLRGPAPRHGRQVAAEEPQQNLGRGPGGKQAKALTTTRLGIVHHAFGDDKRLDVLHVSREADHRALHVQPQDVALRLLQPIPDAGIPDQVVPRAQRPHVNPPRGLLRQRAAVVEQRLLDAFPARRGQLRPSAFHTNQLVALQLPHDLGPVGAARRALRRFQRVVSVEQLLEHPIGLHSPRTRAIGQPGGRRGQPKIFGRLLPRRAEREGHRVGAELRRRAVGRLHDFARVVAVHPVGDDDIAQLGFPGISGANAAHGQAARLIGVDQPRRRVAGRLAAHLVGSAQGHAQPPVSVGGLIPAPPDREPEPRRTRRLLPLVQPALVHRAHRIILARRSGNDQHRRPVRRPTEPQLLAAVRPSSWRLPSQIVIRKVALSNCPGPLEGVFSFFRPSGLRVGCRKLCVAGTKFEASGLDRSISTSR